MERGRRGEDEITGERRLKENQGDKVEETRR